MLDNPYYYNGTIKKIIAVFGSIFNNIHTAKIIDGKMTNVARVPLAYGPKEHTLARLNYNNDPNSKEAGLIAVKVPRMSFEISSIEYDTGSKLNRLNQTLIPIDGTTMSKARQWQSVPYNIGLQLSVYARNQDDALQIVEQIFPLFTPEYTIAVKDLEGPNTSIDVPITLTGVTFSDDYAGSFETTKRTLIYTLDFNVKCRFIASPNTNVGIIKKVEVKLYDTTISDNPDTASGGVKVEVDPSDAGPDDVYTIETTFGFI
mgnify:CR=1 FL=1|tara:strand:- start:316 stop:1095 length:780 start_codon:yes stop_codon:yes gene_type:complete